MENESLDLPSKGHFASKEEEIESAKEMLRLATELNKFSKKVCERIKKREEKIIKISNPS